MSATKNIFVLMFAMLLLAGCAAVSNQPRLRCPQLPLPEQVKIISDSRTAPEGERLVIFLTDEPFSAIQQFYDDAFLKSGWEVLLKTDSGVRYGRREGVNSFDCQTDLVINRGKNNKIESVVVKDASLGK